MELLSGVEGQQGEEKLLIARQDTLDKERQRLLSEAEAQVREAQERQRALDSMGIFSGEEREALQQQIEAENQALLAISVECDRMEAALEEKKSRIMEELNRLSDKK